MNLLFIFQNCFKEKKYEEKFNKFLKVHYKITKVIAIIVLALVILVYEPLMIVSCSTTPYYNPIIDDVLDMIL